MITSAPTNEAAVHGESALQPLPEEKTWKYYSRHHEVPVSGLSSLAVHVAAVGVLIVGGLLTAKVASNDRPLEIAAAVVSDAGDKDAGMDRSSGMAKNEEDVKSAVNPSPAAAPVFGPLAPVKPKALVLPDETKAERAIGAISQKALGDLAQQAQNALRQGGGQPGEGTGEGGAPNGSPDGMLRIERRQRWQLNFEVSGPIDHLRQFAALGAILAVPEPEGGFRIFKNLDAWPGLKRQTDNAARFPPSEHVGTLADLHRIGFADREPKTVAEVAEILGTPLAPCLLAFFPKELEEKMARLERQFHHRRDEDIHSKTYFKVVPRGSGYDVVIDTSRTSSP